MQVQGSETGSKGPKSSVSLEYLPSGVALISLGSEPVVVLDFDRLSAFKDAISQVKQKSPKGLVITGSSTEMFTVGADIHAIKNVTDPKVGEDLAKLGQAIFGEVEDLPFPTVAAISGPCVGGGCELALACNVRLISSDDSSRIGLPEVKLGIVPGFGGTQRLPRLIGLPKALDIIAAGKVLRPKQAIRRGLVNEVLPAEKLLARADEIASGKSTAAPVKIGFFDKLLTNTSYGRSFVAKKARAQIKKQTNGFYPAPPAALEAAILGLEKGLKIGLEREAQELGKMIVTPESKSLVRMFFLTESAKAIGKSARSAVKDFHSVVIGAGTMGAGIASVIARYGGQVILKDTKDTALERAKGQATKYLEKLRFLSESERSFILNRIETTTGSSSNIGNTGFVIEAVFEDLEVKKKVLGEMARMVQQDAIIATNTSSLSVTKIAESLDNPERVVGMHFFNPVEKMPLVEIVRGEKTSDRTIAVVGALTSMLGKYPIVVADVPGFLVNRVLTPYLNEAGRLLAEGNSVEVIDAAATSFGLPMGPFRVLDEVGLDVATHVAQIMIDGYGDRMASQGFTKKLVAAGRKGKKSGGGFYDFDGKEAKPFPELRSTLGIVVPHMRAPKDEIIDRLIFALLGEAILCLDEGVAGAPSPEAADQIDLGLVMGMGFPPFRGGLLHYAEQRGLKDVLEGFKVAADKFGPRFNPPKGLEERVRTGKGFR